MNPLVVSVVPPVVTTGLPQQKQPPPAKGPQLDDFCRVCLLRKPQLRPLTNQYEGVMIPEMLFKVSGTLLNILEQLPRVICDRCLQKLDLAYHISSEFRKQEELLRSFCWKGALVDQLEEYQQTEESQRRPYSESVIDKLATVVHPTPPELTSDPVPMPVEQVVIQELLSAEQFDDMIERESVGSEPSPPAVQSDEGFEMILEVANLETVKESQLKLERLPEDPPEATTFSVELLPSTLPLKAEWVEEDGGGEDSEDPEETMMTHDDDDDDDHDIGAESSETIDFGFSQQEVGRGGSGRGFMPRKYKNVPNENGHYDCGDCGKTFAVRKTFLNHVRRHELLQTGKFECFQCGKCFGTKERLVRHETIHERDLVCGECGHESRNGYDFRAHARTHQTGLFKCRRCIFSCSTRKVLMRHHAEECPKRSNSSSSSSGISATTMEGLVKGKAPQVYATGKGGGGSEKVKKPQKCPVEGCDYVADSYGTMYVHKRSKHAPKFICEICDKSFAFANLLREHEKLHTGEKPYQCEWCEKSFRRIFSYKEHVAVHEEATTYDCQVCGKGFSRPRYLTAHMLTHSEERNFVCSVCSKRYKTNGELTKHVQAKHTLDYGKGDDLIEEDYNYFEDDIVIIQDANDDHAAEVAPAANRKGRSVPGNSAASPEGLRQR